MRTRFLAVLLLVGCSSASPSPDNHPTEPQPQPVPPRARSDADDSRDLAVRLQSTVEMLARTIGERNTSRKPEALDSAASWIAAELARHGTPVEQSYEVDGKVVKNIEVVLPGSDAQAGAVVVGAHYDSAVGTPGADDNASGVAVLLELVRLLVDQPRRRELRLVAFANEEPPHFKSDAMGSLVYARKLERDGAKVVAMLSLESVGFFSDEKGSQKYPPPLSALYPDVGNFIAIVGNTESAGLVDQIHAGFSEASAFPVQKGTFPGALPGVSWSDHWSFWQIGVPAVMITDTAPYRNPHYHEPSDTHEVVDSGRMAEVTRGLASVLSALVNG